MGRKIPAKKHRGVKDPLEQQARRLQSLKSKINAPPSAPDEQPVPRSLERLFAFQRGRSAAGARPARPDKPPGKANKAGGGGNPVSRLRRLPGEASRAFSLRISAAARALHGEAALEYPPDMEEEDDPRGARMAALRERRARKERRRATRAGGPGGPAGPGGPDPPPRARTHRLELKRKAKLEKAEESERSRREVQHERVPFGDVASAPPALAPHPALAAAKPGRRGLLLAALLPGGGGGAAGEERRLAAVRAYRELKAARGRGRGGRPA